MMKGSETALLQAVKQYYKLLDLKEMSNVKGEPVVLITIIVAETAGEDFQFWELPLASFLARAPMIFEKETNLPLSSLILDGIKLGETGNLNFPREILAFLGKRHIGLQIFASELTSENFY